MTIIKCDSLMHTNTISNDKETIIDSVAGSVEEVRDWYFKMKYKSYHIHKFEDYFYSIDIDDEYEYDDEKYRPYFSACTGVSKGNIVGRNFDWYYNNSCEFLCRVSAKENRHASIGMVNANSVSMSDLEDETWKDSFRNIPWYTVDGINDAGVYVEINVVPIDRGVTTGTNPGKPRMIGFAIPRYILDNASSADNAIELLGEVSIYTPLKTGYDIHALIKDSEKTYCVEFIENKMVCISDFPDDKEIMTNFHLYGFDGNCSTKTYNSETYDPSTTTLTKHACGVERYDIVSNGYDDVEDVDDMLALMKNIKYTKSYTEPWYSEFFGTYDSFGDMTIDSTEEEMSGIISLVEEMYEERDRDTAKTWHTVHTSVCDISNKTYKVVVQEGNTEYDFTFDSTWEDDIKNY